MNENAKGSTSRIFFALWPNEEERGAMYAWLPALKQLCKGRQMRKANLHATLIFIGQADQAQVDAAISAVSQVQGQAFTVNWNEIRYWPHNHIVHAAPAQIPGDLITLERKLKDKLKETGIVLEQRSYLPHVTLIRNARCGNQGLPEVEPVTWKVEEFMLMQSVNEVDGTRYEVLARFPLS